jgi:anti-sigma factor RsiW
MNEAHAHLDAHAYVDDSLSPAARADFEAALRRDVKLRARVDAWQAQSEAIRLAFGPTGKPRQTPPLGRPSNENSARPKVSPPPSLRTRARVAEPVRAVSRWRRRAALGVSAFAIGLVAFAGGSVDPRRAMMRRADTALRTVSVVAEGRLDFVSDDPRAIAGWLGGRFARLDPKRLSPPGWSPVGVRIVPGLASAAALVIYEDALGGRGGLMVEPTDALPDLPPAGGRFGDETILAGAEGGFAYAVVGPRRSGVGALIPAPASR